MGFTHFDEAGNAIMVDVSDKNVTHREAIASGLISMSKECYEAVKQGTSKKGDVLGVARVAGIMATKQTSNLVPLCHPLPITKSAVDFIYKDDLCEIEAVCTVKTDSKTGVEMEAITGTMISLLTIYDMCKAIDKSMEIGKIHLNKKTGGKSGEYIRNE